MSPEQWEEFIEEWAHSLETEYLAVRRLAGAGDQGCDVVGFLDEAAFVGVWDNYQCKRYHRRLTPSDVWPEIAKVIYHSWKGEYKAPRRYYFVASQGLGTALQKLLLKPATLRLNLEAIWADKCAANITTSGPVQLQGEFKTYFDAFDFSIFSYKSVAELIIGHQRTPFYSTRFGGGLPTRPLHDGPPNIIQSSELRYVQQLLAAYSDHLGRQIENPLQLDSEPELAKHFQRSRESFFSAEALRNFARDAVPPGTFEHLQDEIHHGVVDTCESPHADGLARVRATTNKAADLALTSNALCSCTETQDRHGVCHQLANVDGLIWVK